MSDQLIVERGGLEKKDKSELQAIVSALGGSASSRARKADLIDQIIELSQQAAPGPSKEEPSDEAPTDEAPSTADTQAETKPESDSANTSDGDGAGDKSPSHPPDEGSSAPETSAKADSDSNEDSDGAAKQGANNRGGRGQRGARSGRKNSADSGSQHPVGPDGEPLADWEIELADSSQSGGQKGGGRNKDRNRGDSNRDSNRDNNRDANRGDNRDGNRGEGDTDPNRRSRRRGRGRGRDRDEAGNDPISTEPVPVAGSLDLRDEGYGFLRVAGYLPSKEDVYVSVKQVRQYGLRKGDHLTGLSRPANRNEKNPGFHQIDAVNGKPPEEARKRPRFDDLTPLFPDERLVLEMREEPLNMTTRIVDLVAPIGKGQRGLIVSPPKAGKTTVMKDIARAIETNNPEVRLIVLLLDERPEEVTDMKRHLRNGEVAASTFDRPPEEHCAVAELTIERAKRLVEVGEDVCLIVDGITRLSRAYNLTAPQTGRAMSGGLDAAALYPPKRFFGAARNLEEGGSLTILATALVDTGSRMDEVIFEEFKGTGNMELRLDRRLAEKRIFPAIDVDGSSTRHEELLFDAKELKLAWKLRRVLSAMGEEGSSAGGVEMLTERLGTFKTNADFLAEMAKTPSV
ncbi:MAG: transcription termination factor Rho [Actinomycetia bacterium]|nr:transcription termination factor Rho [Actinomycetes bacterium]